jgi:hypothetical protein
MKKMLRNRLSLNLLLAQKPWVKKPERIRKKTYLITNDPQLQIMQFYHFLPVIITTRLKPRHQKS